MKMFDFLFGVSLGEMVLRHTDNLSKTLQDQLHDINWGERDASCMVECTPINVM